MKLKQIYDEIDKLAPFALSKEYCERFGHYDNSGILLDCGEVITGVLFSLDLTEKAIEEAKKLGANCIVTHHPAIFAALKSLAEGSLILVCARAGISVISAHLNLDSAESGIDASLMEGLGGKVPVAVMDNLTGGGYGRVYETEEKSLESFAEHIKRTFSAKRIISYGERPVKRVASFCGAGFDEHSLAFALANGVDTIVSSDAKHHLLLAAAERGINVVLLTHYAAEWYGFVKFFERMKGRLEIPCHCSADKRFL